MSDTRVYFRDQDKKTRYFALEAVAEHWIGEVRLDGPTDLRDEDGLYRLKNGAFVWLFPPIRPEDGEWKGLDVDERHGAMYDPDHAAGWFVGNRLSPPPDLAEYVEARNVGRELPPAVKVLAAYRARAMAAAVEGPDVCRPIRVQQEVPAHHAATEQPGKLTQAETNILEAIGTGILTGPQLVSRAGYKYDHLRKLLPSLVRRGLLEKTGKGYRRPLATPPAVQ